MKVSLCSVCLHELMKDYIFIQNSLLQSGSWCASFEIVLLKSFLFLFFFSFCFCCLAGFSGHRIHIKKHGSVVECYVHVCWYTVLWRVCVCVESKLLAVFFPVACLCWCLLQIWRRSRLLWKHRPRPSSHSKFSQVVRATLLSPRAGNVQYWLTAPCLVVLSRSALHIAVIELQMWNVWGALWSVERSTLPVFQWTYCTPAVAVVQLSDSIAVMS